MNKETAHIYEGPEEVQKAKDRGEPLIKIPSRDLNKVKAMTKDDRKSYANHLAKRRKQRKVKRKANRKRRGRR